MKFAQFIQSAFSQENKFHFYSFVVKRLDNTIDGGCINVDFNLQSLLPARKIIELFMSVMTSIMIYSSRHFIILKTNLKSCTVFEKLQLATGRPTRVFTFINMGCCCFELFHKYVP